MRRLVVDGYNVLHAWPVSTQALGERGLEDARRMLLALLAEYSAGSGVEVIVVFDAHGRASGRPAREVVDGVVVMFGTATSSADAVIERLMYESTREGLAGETVVATSDRLQRAMVSAMGVATMSAPALLEEIGVQTRERGAEVSRRRDDARFAGRLEHRIDEATWRRLEAIRRGEEEPDAP